MERKCVWGLWILLFCACSPPEKLAEPPLLPPTALPATRLALEDLSAFQAPNANWQIVGSVAAPVSETVVAMEATPGTGVLVNAPTEEAKGDLYFGFEHGDLELTMDFMLPKGSNSGVYLMGRYEVQLFDSWGKTEVGPGDCGGIYQRWDESRPEGQKGYEGYAPLLNACRAPGLWQKIKIRFRAPRFDAQGQKIEAARIEGVWLNDYPIQRDLTLSGPTRGSFFENEAAKGPIVIQGDHGPVAFRNIGYKVYEDKRVTLSPLQYQFYKVETPTNRIDSVHFFPLTERNPDQTGTTDSLSVLLSPERADFVMSFAGKMTVPEAGTYFFRGRVGGGYIVFVDGEKVLDADGERGFSEDVAYGQKALTAGNHDFQLIYLQNNQFWRNGFGLWVEGPGMDFHPLHTDASVPSYSPPRPMWVSVAQGPKLQRSFVMHQGKKLTHTISLGTPQGVHMNYDLSQGRLLNLWRGRFLDAEPMWRGRGESQLSDPGGPVISLAGDPTFVPTSYPGSAWPHELAENEIRYLGYELDAAGYPQFLFKIGELTLTDAWLPIAEGMGWKRTLSAQGSGSIRVLLDRTLNASSDNGTLYRMENGTYYLRLTAADKDKVQRKASAGGTTLTAQLKAGESLAYEWIW